MVTVSDIAKLAGVSATTVSRAFNPESVIKESTRKQIIKIAEELNYTPNFNARSLVTRKNYIIGVFFTSMYQGTSSIFLGDIISQLYQALPKNYLLSVNSVDRLTEMGSSVENRFDGILIISQSSADNELIYRIKAAGLPLVVVNRMIEDADIISVVGREQPAIQAALLKALENHQQFGIINGIDGFDSSNQRRRIFFDFLAQYPGKITSCEEITGDYSIESGRIGMLKLLDLPKDKRPSFVFCANDDMAIGALSACKERNISVPGQTAIMGYDDIPYASVVSPGLTTVHNPYKEIGAKGLQLLLQLINGQPIEGNRYEIDAHLVIRHSTN